MVTTIAGGLSPLWLPLSLETSKSLLITANTVMNSSYIVSDFILVEMNTWEPSVLDKALFMHLLSSISTLISCEIFLNIFGGHHPFLGQPLVTLFWISGDTYVVL